MENTMFLAQLIGIYALVMGSSMALRKKMLLGVFRDMSKERSLSYLLGVMVFIIGLLLILNHDVWTSPASKLITVLGWMVAVEGAVFLFVSEKQLKGMLVLLNKENIYYTITLGYLLIGAYLIYIGFL